MVRKLSKSFTAPLLIVLVLVSRQDGLRFAGAAANRGSANADGEKLKRYPLKLSVDARTQRVVDGDGRERYFHGTNVVYKRAPFLPPTGEFDAQFSLGPEDLDLLESMGYNSIRLGFIWAGAEPTRGSYNETYFKLANDIVESAGKKGIYTVLDMHQDVYSEKFCGEGLPDWAVEFHDFPYPLLGKRVVLDKDGHPNRTTCDSINGNVWSAYYSSYDVNTLVENFYSNKDGLLDSFARFWGKVAETWADSPHVIGYELINEPWVGDVYKNPLLLIPGVAARFRMQPMYDRLAEEIYARDESKLVFFQGATWDLINLFGIGFSKVPGGEQFRNRSVLAFHNSIAPGVVPDYLYYNKRKREMEKLGCAGWVTETNPEQLDLLDEHALSWHHWSYKWFANITYDHVGPWKTNGPYEPCRDRHNLTACLDTFKVRLFARPYPKAVAGTVISFRFSRTEKVFTLRYRVNPGCSLPTEIYTAAAWHYPQGMFITVKPPSLASWRHAGKNHIEIWHREGAGEARGPAAEEPDIVTVEIRSAVAVPPAGEGEGGDDLDVESEEDKGVLQAVQEFNSKSEIRSWLELPRRLRQWMFFNPLADAQ